MTSQTALFEREKNRPPNVIDNLISSRQAKNRQFYFRRVLKNRKLARRNRTNNLGKHTLIKETNHEKLQIPSISVPKQRANDENNLELSTHRKLPSETGWKESRG